MCTEQRTGEFVAQAEGIVQIEVFHPSLVNHLAPFSGLTRVHVDHVMGVQIAVCMNLRTDRIQTGFADCGELAVIRRGCIEPSVAQKAVTVVRQNRRRLFAELAAGRGEQTEIGTRRASPENIRERTIDGINVSIQIIIHRIADVLQNLVQLDHRRERVVEGDNQVSRLGQCSDMTIGKVGAQSVEKTAAVEIQNARPGRHIRIPVDCQVFFVGCTGNPLILLLKHRYPS